MSTFNNTADILGDDILIDSIIDRTVVEYRDDTCTYVGVRAFSGCGSLVVVDVSRAVKLYDRVFENCYNLTMVNLDAVTNIQAAVFESCSDLITLIIRNVSSVCALANKSSFTSTPIASGTGYIYVPSALIDSYKAATNWSTYADQFRALEDYTVDGTTTGELDETKI